MSIAASRIGMFSFARARSVNRPPVQAKDPGRATSAALGPVKQIDAGVLNVGYADLGPANGPAVVLLHGWPYDIQGFAEVVPLLSAKGYRVIVPY